MRARRRFSPGTFRSPRSRSERSAAAVRPRAAYVRTRWRARAGSAAGSGRHPSSKPTWSSRPERGWQRKTRSRRGRGAPSSWRWPVTDASWGAGEGRVSLWRWRRRRSARACEAPGQHARGRAAYGRRALAPAARPRPHGPPAGRAPRARLAHRPELARVRVRVPAPAAHGGGWTGSARSRSNRPGRAPGAARAANVRLTAARSPARTANGLSPASRRRARREHRAAAAALAAGVAAGEAGTEDGESEIETSSGLESTAASNHVLPHRYAACAKAGFAADGCPPPAAACSGVQLGLVVSAASRALIPVLEAVAEDDLDPLLRASLLDLRERRQRSLVGGHGRLAKVAAGPQLAADHGVELSRVERELSAQVKEQEQPDHEACLGQITLSVLQHVTDVVAARHLKDLPEGGGRQHADPQIGARDRRGGHQPEGDCEQADVEGERDDDPAGCGQRAAEAAADKAGGAGGEREQQRDQHQQRQAAQPLRQEAWPVLDRHRPHS